MTTNDPGREPEPTDAELLRDFEAADVRLSNACENCMDFSEDGEPTDPEYLDAEHEWNLCSERREARGREYLSGARPMPDTKLCGAVTQAGEDRKFRTCEKPAGHDGMHETTICGQGWSWMPDTPAPSTGAECQHGHLARKCETCELIAAEARVAELNESIRFWQTNATNTYRDNTALTARVAELEAEVAAAKADAASWEKQADDRAGDAVNFATRITDLERENAELRAELVALRNGGSPAGQRPFILTPDGKERKYWAGTKDPGATLPGKEAPDGE